MVNLNLSTRQNELWLLRNYATGDLRRELDELFEAGVAQDNCLAKLGQGTLDVDSLDASGEPVCVSKPR